MTLGEVYLWKHKCWGERDSGEGEQHLSAHQEIIQLAQKKMAGSADWGEVPPPLTQAQHLCGIHTFETHQVGDRAGGGEGVYRQVGWEGERRSGQPTRSERKAEKSPVLLPLITVPLFQCQRPSGCASAYKGVNVLPSCLFPFFYTREQTLNAN